MCRLVLKLFIISIMSFSWSGEAVSKALCNVPQKPFNVWYFRPDGMNSFWYSSETFALEVANDLNVNLTVFKTVQGDDNRIGFKAFVDSTFEQNRSSPPDFVISILYGGAEYTQIEHFQKLGVPFFSVNTSLDNQVLNLTGSPREKYGNWKAHMSPDEKRSGMRLVERLTKYSDGKTIGIVAGATQSKVNVHRVAGAIDKAEQLKLNIIPPIYTDWSRESSATAMATLLRRVPDIDMVWAAGSDITLGVMDALKLTERKLIVGSFD